MKTKTKTTKKNKRYIPLKILCGLLIFVGALCLFSANWYITVYGDLGFDSILYTLFNGLGGVQGGLLTDYALKGILPTLLVTALGTFLLFYKSKKQLKISFKDKKEFRIFPFYKTVSLLVSAVLFLTMTFTAADKVRLFEYVKNSTSQTKLYDEKYVDPLTAEIKFPEKKRNLIYIYLESMETTFFGEEQGGALPQNVIPELYALGKENVNFSHNGEVGGFMSTDGASWTMGALVAQSSGIPLKIPSNFAENSYGKETFLKGAAGITNILKNEGYHQVLLFGSDASFANRDKYYLDHGIDRIYDYYTAKDDKIIPDDYFAWWGMEDKKLFDYAKKILSEISKGDKPFAFTTLTVDTHHIDGYKCEYCGSRFEEQYENVLSCSSRQVYDFIEWIKEQPFYEDTSIVVVGDHLTMDWGYINRNVDENYTRHVYNCFINSSVEPVNNEYRIFTAMDMFPSTLASLGCQIKGERLGLGTNMFSAVPTLAEEMGYDTFRDEMNKNSAKYTMDFMLS